jgi:hypothetical protein
MLRWLLASALVLLVSAPGFSQSPSSADLSKQLTELLVAQHSDAVAAADPDTPGRFVAALVFPNSQMLVVSAAYPAPAQLLQQIAAKDYRDVYLTLQQAGSREGKLFFQDMGGDGLRRDADAVDVLYENGVDQFLFDRAHRPRGLSDSAFQQKFSSSETTYARLLRVLIDQLKNPQGTIKP